MGKSDMAIIACVLSIVGFSVWFTANYDNTDWNTSAFEEVDVHSGHDHNEDESHGYEVLQEQNTVLPLRDSYSVVVNGVSITPMKTIDDSLYALLKEYYAYPEYISEDYQSDLVSIEEYSNWMTENVNADGNVEDMSGQPQYRMLMGGQLATGGYVAVFTCNLINEVVKVKDAPIIGWVVMGDGQTEFSCGGLHYGATASEVDAVLGVDYELQVIDSDANIIGRIYTYEDGSTLTCDMSNDTLVGLVYSENIFKYVEVE